MLEIYTENARGAIAHARNEAKYAEKKEIDLRGLIFGVLESSPVLIRGLLRKNSTLNELVGYFKVEPTGTWPEGDIPLSNEVKQVLDDVEVLRKKLDHIHIGSEHMLLILMTKTNENREVLRKHLLLEKLEKHLSVFTPEK